MRGFLARVLSRIFRSHGDVLIFKMNCYKLEHMLGADGHLAVRVLHHVNAYLNTVRPPINRELGEGIVLLVSTTYRCTFVMV